MKLYIIHFFVLIILGSPSFTLETDTDSESLSASDHQHFKSKATSLKSLHSGQKSKEHHHVYYTTSLKKNSKDNITDSSSDAVELIESINITNDSPLLKSLKTLKIVNTLNHNKKKNVYPGIVIQNFHEKQLSEDILNDLTKFGAYSKLLSQLMHSIVNKELGLSKMQQSIDQMSFQSSTVKFDKIIDDISDKMLKKIEDIHSAIEMTGERVEEIFKQQLTSNITTDYLNCCEFFTAILRNDYKTNELIKLYSMNNYNTEIDMKMLNNIKSKEQEVKSGKYQFDNHLNTWINKQFACDINDDFRKPHFFTPSSQNLTDQFKSNLNQNPNIKWQYFMSFLGVHVEYPSYLPPNNYCFLHTLNNEQTNSRSKYSNENDRINLTNGFIKRFKYKNKKHDSLYHHKKAYYELNQLFIQRHQENLLSTALPQSKLVVIVIDRGSALTDHQLNIAKSVAKYILNSLSHKDKVGIVDLTSTVQYPSSETCSSKLELAYANYETKHFYSRYIDELQRSHNSTNHFLGFQKAFEIISSNYLSFKNEIGTDPEIFIPYISRGFLASITDAIPVMELISNELKNRTYNFAINTYALIDESKPIMYETTFLKEIAAMNFRRFNVDSPSIEKIRPGLMVALNNTENLSFTLNGIYSVLSNANQDSYSNIYLSLPHYDFITKDTHVSISKAFSYNNHLLGIVGVDISFFYLAQEVIHYDYSSNSYAFLVDAHSGKLLYHPIFSHNNRFNYKRQNKFNSFINYDYYFQNSFTNVEHVEQATDFSTTVKHMIMNSNSGMYTIKMSFPFNDVSQVNNDSYLNFLNDRLHVFNRYKTITYYWRRVSFSPYIVVIAVYGNQEKSLFDGEFHLVKNIHFRPDASFRPEYITHRLDYVSAMHKNNVKLCKHFNQLATLDTATLYLTSSAFINSYKFEVESDSMDTVQKYMDYLKDSTLTVENPGLKDNIRGDINAMGSIIDLWKKLLDSSEASKYIVRKYTATTSGAFMVYPGALFDSTYNPKTRPWFTRAVSNPGKLIFIPPYLDIGGGGYIVTLSQTVYEGKSSESHSENDQIWGVMGIDITLGYFHKIIDEMVPICSRNKASCFIMDDYGYLIVHSSFLKPALTSFIERQHITHKEPQMVNDLLNQKNFVRKLVCNSYNDRTIQRYYMFNSSLIGIVTNVVQSEDSSCAKYKIVSLDSTNAFFGIVNHTCDNSTTFCPCSLTDRLCLNCHRMEQTDCECPCECPLVMNLCTGQLLEKEDKNPSCVSAPESMREPSVPKYLFDSLDSCVNSACFNKHTESDCRGVLGCEWCSMDNGIFLKKPFCTNQNLCFGGIYGSKNPYLNNFYYHHHESYKPPYNAPIGPLTSTIIVCFIILTFSVYCFHFQSTRNFSTRYLNSNHNEHQILQHSNEVNDSNENDFQEGNVEAVVGLVQASMNPNFENIISPYQVNSNFRRTETESDYGYSTMTPKEDSDLNGSIYINPNIIKTNKKPSKHLDLLDISTSTTLGSSSVASNDDLSTLSSPSSSSSTNDNKRLPPPPKSTFKVRTKQKYVDSSHSKQLKATTTLLTVNEDSSLQNECNNTTQVM